MVIEEGNIEHWELCHAFWVREVGRRTLGTIESKKGTCEHSQANATGPSKAFHPRIRLHTTFLVTSP